MRLRRTKLQAFFLASMVVMLCGCMAGSFKALAKPPEMTLTGRVLSVTEVTIFEGDLAVIGYSYAIEPRNNSNNIVIVVGDKGECAAGDNDGALYRLNLQKRSMHFGIKNKVDKALISDLFIVACEKITTSGLQTTR